MIAEQATGEHGGNRHREGRIERKRRRDRERQQDREGAPG